jgi:hypothetical protein
MHRRWMAGLRFEQAAHHIVLEDCIAAVEAATARRDRLEAHIERRGHRSSDDPSTKKQSGLAWLRRPAAKI